MCEFQTRIFIKNPYVYKLKLAFLVCSAFIVFYALRLLWYDTVQIGK